MPPPHESRFISQIIADHSPGQLLDVEMERPSPGPRDLLVEIRAISVNPVDAKIRGGGGPTIPKL